MVLGPMADWIIRGFKSTAVTGDLSVLGAVLNSIGIPRDSILKYERGLRVDNFLVIAHGTREEVERAREILNVTSINECSHYPVGFQAG